MQNESEKQEFLIDVITAFQDVNNVFLVKIVYDNVGKWIPLSIFFGLIVSNKGSWQSLGSAFNPSPGINTIETIIYYIVPGNSNFVKELKDVVFEFNQSEKGVDNDNQGSQG